MLLRPTPRNRGRNLSSRLLIGLVLGLTCSGCKTTTETDLVSDNPASFTSAPSSATPSTRLRNGTYSLLYELLSKVRNIDKILLVKNERAAVGDLVVEIAQTAADAADAMEEWAQSDRSLKIKEHILPEAEVKARDSIGSKRTKQLLFSVGEKFELNLLLSQAEALGYGGQLAQLAASQDSSLARRMRLEELSRKMEQLHERLQSLLMIRAR